MSVLIDESRTRRHRAGANGHGGHVPRPGADDRPRSLASSPGVTPGMWGTLHAEVPIFLTLSPKVPRQTKARVMLIIASSSSARTAWPTPSSKRSTPSFRSTPASPRAFALLDMRAACGRRASRQPHHTSGLVLFCPGVISPGSGKNGHHARPDSQAGQRRRSQPQRHRSPTKPSTNRDEARHRPIHVHRYRRRSHHWDLLPRCHSALQ